MRFFVRVLRGIAVSFFFALYGIGGLLLGFGLLPVLALTGNKSRFIMRRVVRGIYICFVRLLEITGMIRIRITRKDRKKISRIRGCVVVANHPTLIDIVILMSILPDSTGLAKTAAKKNFFYSRIVSSVFISNTDAGRTVTEAVETLRKGVNLIVFPQGTRTQEGEKRKLFRGAAQMALRSGKDITVLSIVPSVPFLGKKQLWCDVGDRTIDIDIKVLKTVRTTNKAPTRANAEKITKTFPF